MCDNCKEMENTCDISVFTKERNSLGGRATICLGKFCDTCVILVTSGEIKLTIPDNAITAIEDIFAK